MRQVLATQLTEDACILMQIGCVQEGINVDLRLYEKGLWNLDFMKRWPQN